jgi:thiol:disulfide interchange protein DsbD
MMDRPAARGRRAALPSTMVRTMNTRFPSFALVLAALLTSALPWTPASAQDNPFDPGGGQVVDPSGTQISARIEPAEARRGETVMLKITVTMNKEWHTYPLVQVDPAAKVYQTEIKMRDAAGLEVGRLQDPAPLKKAEPALKIKELRYYDNEVTWEWPLTIPESAQPGKKVVKVRIDTQVCHDDRGCVPQKKDLEVALTVSDAPPVARSTPPPPSGGTDPAPTADSAGLSLASTGLWSFLLQGVIFGAVSLITPCVFPMIPITVSFFIKQSEKEHHRPLTMALVYTLTIVVVLTLAALLLLVTFRELSVHPATNLILGGLFIFFALSLFGMYEIQLPSGLARLTASQEGRGGLLGTMFMALTFTIISFTCVAPFLGGFAGFVTVAESGADWVKLALGALAFAVTFAAPFFLLALFPTALKALPKSGSWMNAVKVVMGFLELAAALKFLRTAELLAAGEATFLTYDFVLGLYVAISLLCGLYLLGVYRLPHDTPIEHIGVARLLFSFLFLGLGFYLVPGMFQQRPRGEVFAWLDSFLLPDQQTAPRGTVNGNDPQLAANGNQRLPWIGNLTHGLQQAYSPDVHKRKLIFLNFTGLSCTNCSLNENNVFTRPEIEQLLKQYVLVELYTDRIPPKFAGVSDAAENLQLHKDRFKSITLPLYVILEPLADGAYKELARYDKGLIRDPQEFTAFLSKPLQAQPGTATASER